MRHDHFRPIVEELESRQLLAGNVSAVLSKGNLILTGDVQDNSITISSVAPGLIRVQGTSGTTVNGLSLQQFLGVTGKVTVRLKGGFDGLSVSNADLPRGLVYEAGGGSGSSLLILNSNISKSVRYQGGLGNDTALIQTSIVGGNLSLVFGEGVGSQALQIDQDSRVFGNLLYSSLGAVADSIAIRLTTVHGATTLNTAGGSDGLAFDDATFLGAFTANTGSGGDAFVIDTTDVVALAGDTTFGGRVDLRAGSGFDSVVLGDNSSSNTRVVFRVKTSLNGGSDHDVLLERNVDVDSPLFYATINFEQFM